MAVLYRTNDPGMRTMTQAHHHWQTHESGWVTCRECEAHASWCDYPPEVIPSPTAVEDMGSTDGNDTDTDAG